jgi:hypothetical protein
MTRFKTEHPQAVLVSLENIGSSNEAYELRNRGYNRQQQADGAGIFSPPTFNMRACYKAIGRMP